MIAMREKVNNPANKGYKYAHIWNILYFFNVSVRGGTS